MAGDLIDFLTLVGFATVQLIVGAVSLLLSPLFYVLERKRSSALAPKQPYKSVFITGGSSGLGEGLALHYSKPGVLVAFTGRNKERLEAVAERCRAKGADVMTKVVDVTEKDALRAFIDQVDNKVPIDLIIANAGIGGISGNTDDTTYSLHQGFTDITATNLQGVWNTIFPTVERMCQRGKGQVALMSSLSSYFPVLATLEYAAAKSNLTSAGRSLRRYCEQFGVSVCTICPGFVRTNILPSNDKYLNELTVDQAVAEIADGLTRNVPVINFPRNTYFLANVVGLLHPVVYDTLGRKMTATAGSISKFFADKKKTK